VTFGLLGALLVSLAPPARATSLLVETLTDAVVNNGDCSLREAIVNANNDDQSGSTDCAVGSGADTISFSVTGTIYLVLELPPVVAAGGALTISGPGPSSLTISGDTSNDDDTTANVRIIRIQPGASLALSGVTMSEGDAAGSIGGAISTEGTLTITSSTLSDNIAMDGGGVFIHSSGTVTVTGSAFSDNVTSSSGGAIYNDGGTLDIASSTFSGNDTSFRGGGIYNSAGTVTVTSSTFSGNGAQFGGALNNGGALDVKNSTFSVNSADYGGGIDNFGGTLHLTNSTFSSNSVSQEGGGINNTGTLTATRSTFSGNSASLRGGGMRNVTSGTATVTSSTFSGNGAQFGGGVANGGTLDVASSTFSSNTALTGAGGGIDNFGGTLHLTNSTFWGNTSLEGGGIYNDGTLTIRYATFSDNGAADEGGGIRNVGSATLWSTIVANSPSGEDCTGAIVDGGYNLSSDFSCGFSGTSQAGTNPQLQSLANNGGPTQTMALSDPSPAANVIPEGQPSGAECGTTIDTDQRGFVRPEDDLCEIGAYEIQDQAPQPPPVVAPPDVLTMSPTSGPVGTIVTITGTNLANALVRFNGIAAPVQVSLPSQAPVTVPTNTPTQIVVAVPTGATTGPVTVHTSGGSDTAGIFTVTTTPPSISGFSPSMGQVGTAVVITGTGFTGTAVAFGGVEADFVVDSSTQITAIVPPGAGTGQVQVATSQGTAFSPGAFVVTHARSASLHHSRARGSLSVPDGWSACAARAPVRLQRWEGGRFVTVGSATTNGAGSFRFGEIDEPGRYRAVGKPLTLASGDVCLKARSPVVTW
jgi:CSLREA domain-containing protein